MIAGSGNPGGKRKEPKKRKINFPPACVCNKRRRWSYIMYPVPLPYSRRHYRARAIRGRLTGERARAGPVLEVSIDPGGARPV